MAFSTDSNVESTMNKAGYINLSMLARTLQGSIWRAQQVETGTNNGIFHNVVAKATNIYLHSQSMMVINGKEYKINENILNEMAILEYLSKTKRCPNSIIKYIDSFQR